MAEDNKVLVIGLDGATFDLIDPWIKQGKLPTLADCLSRGVRAGLRSTPLSNSAQAWSSFITGKNPGKHGIYDFFRPLTDSYGVRFINASFRQGKSLWRMVSDAGKSVGVMNVPITYPAEEINGFLIPGLDSPGIGQDFAYPPGLIKEIQQKVGGYILEPGIWGFIRRGQYDVALTKLLETIDLRTAAAKYLMSSRPWDLFVVVYTASDKVQHHFWKFIDPARSDSGASAPYTNAILQVYQRLDDSIRQLIEAVDENTEVFIISDHGAGSSTNKSMFINHWLKHEGLLGYKAKDQLSQGWRGLIQQADRLVKKRLSRKGKEWLLRHFPTLRNQVSSVLSLPGIDWPRTAAYSRENHPAIYINLKGREPQGIVCPGQEYEAVCQSIIDKLLSLRCPESGERIVEEAYCKDKVYHGAQESWAPDIIFSWKDYNYVHRPSPLNSDDGFLKILSHKELAESENSVRPSGIHRDYGILISIGNNTRKGQQISPAGIMDIAPTILYLLNIAIPDDMDGRVLLEIFKEEFSACYLPRYYQSDGEVTMTTGPQDYLEEEGKALKERLMGLGYID